MSKECECTEQIHRIGDKVNKECWFCDGEKMVINPSYKVGEKIEFQLVINYDWFPGLISTSDMWGYWYDVVAEDGTRDIAPHQAKHTVFKKVWHARVRKRA